MDLELDPSLLPQITSLLSKTSYTPSDFSFLKSLPPSIFKQIIETLPPESTSKILEFLQTPFTIKKKRPPPTKTLKPTPFLDKFYAKGMFKHLWLEDVKRVHQAILPFSTNETPKQAEFPQQMTLASFEKKPNFLQILCKMAYVFGEPLKDNYLLCQRLLEGIKAIIKVLFDKQVLLKVFSNNPRKKDHKTFKKQAFHQYLTQLFPIEHKRFSLVKESSKFIFSHEKEGLEESFANEEEENPKKNEKEENKCIFDKNNEEFEFVNARIDSMTQEEYLEFSYCRSLNFLSLGREAFLELLGFDSLQESFLKDIKISVLSYEIEFLNYVLCRVTKRLIEKAIIGINGKLGIIKDSIQIKDFEEVLTQEIKGISLKVKKYINKRTSIEEKAFRIFTKEFWAFEYEKILEAFNTRIKLFKRSDEEFFVKKNEELKEDFGLDLISIWKNIKGYQKYWFQRIIAENQLKNMGNNEENLCFLNEYARFLHEKVKNKEEKLNFGGFFKEWFLLKIQGGSKDKIVKKTQKLESIFD